MTDRNIQKKYDIIKARVNAVIEEHADALALAQMFKEESDQLKNQLKEMQNKVTILEEKLKEHDIQKEPKVTILDGSVEAV